MLVGPLSPKNGFHGAGPVALFKVIERPGHETYLRCTAQLPPGQQRAQRIGERRPVEGRGHIGAPVDNHGRTGRVLHVAAAAAESSPATQVVFGEGPMEEAVARVERIRNFFRANSLEAPGEGPTQRLIQLLRPENVGTAAQTAMTWFKPPSPAPLPDGAASRTPRPTSGGPSSPATWTSNAAAGCSAGDNRCWPRRLPTSTSESTTGATSKPRCQPSRRSKGPA